MRLDPKYFNLFIGICAALTVLIIFYSTVRYSQNQVRDFEKRVMEYNFDDLTLKSFTAPDSIHFNQLKLEKSPMIIHFWSTWSERSLEVNQFLTEYRESYPELIVVAVAVRDSDEQIKDYIAVQDEHFTYVEGTAFYQSLKVPGMPSQLLFRADGSLFSTHVGNHLNSLKQELDNLMMDE